MIRCEQQGCRKNKYYPSEDMWKLFLDTWYRTPTGAVMAQANEASAKAQEARVDSSSAQARIDRLILINRALWEILRERLGVTEEELKSKALEIDLRDGRQDNKLRISARKCVGCGKTVNLGRLTCLYCTAPIEGSPFDGI